MSNDNLRDVLNFDPIAEAEKVTGVSYKTEPMDGPTNRLGMSFARANSERKRAILQKRGDTMMRDSVERFTTIAKMAGFQEVLRLPFDYKERHDDKMNSDTFYIYAHVDGILLVFDTYWNNKTTNAAKIYFNWSPKEGITRYPDVGLSGGWRREHNDWKHPIDTTDVFMGSIDVREALVFKTETMRESGKFRETWVEQPFLWLLHHNDTKTEGYDYQAINKERIAMLPEWVRKMIGE